MFNRALQLQVLAIVCSATTVAALFGETHTSLETKKHLGMVDTYMDLDESNMSDEVNLRAVQTRALLAEKHLGMKYRAFTLCKVGHVVVSVDGHGRSLGFDGTTSEQSRVRCSQDASGCQGRGACPCDFASDQDLRGYEKVMVEHLQPICDSPGPRNVMTIGLGGGVLPQYLLHRCKGLQVTVVEPDPDVKQAALEYFGLQESMDKFEGRLHFDDDDAGTALAARANKGQHGIYDAVVVDCFSGDGIVPEDCRSKDSLTTIKTLLKPGGLLLQNMWGKIRGPGYMGYVPYEDFNATKVAYASVFGRDHCEDKQVLDPLNVDFVHVLSGRVPVDAGARDTQAVNGTALDTS